MRTRPPWTPPGAIVEIQTRVHNYSLTPTAGGEQLVISCDTPSEMGEIVSQPLTSIGAQGTSDVITVEWQIPDVPMQDFDQMRLLVEADPAELVSEVHEDNDWGWRPLTSNYVAPVPEPAATWMAAAAPAALAGLRRRRQALRSRPAL